MWLQTLVDFLLACTFMKQFFFLSILYLLCFPRTGHSQGADFVNVTAEQFPDLPPISFGAMAWGDYDADGRTDVIITGNSAGGTQSRLFRNTTDGFIDQTTLLPDLPSVFFAATAWGDYDNDGRLDLIYTGYTGSELVSILYHNTGTGFEDKSDLLPDLPDISLGAVAWGDYDNDGLLDLILTGSTPEEVDGDLIVKAVGILYHNTGTGFEDRSDLLPAVHGAYYSTVSWADYDNDGRLDLFITGNSGEVFISKLFRNTISGFVDQSNLLPDLPQVVSAAVAWGDYDNDGLLDLIISGRAFDFVNSIDFSTTKLYHNTGSGFEDQSVLLEGLEDQFYTYAAWADYDNDGRLDLMLTGQEDSDGLSKLYHNTTTGFVDQSDLLPELAELENYSVFWVDFDNDGKLDLMALGGLGSTFISNLYRNQAVITNTPPAAPEGLTSIANSNGKSVQLSWNPAEDDQTPQPGLSYNLYVSTTPGGQNILAPMADLASGFRRIVQTGSKQTNTFTINNLTPSTTYYWSVQAIDGAFAGSPFAETGSFQTETGLPVHLIQFTANGQETSVSLSWQTAEETNSAFFEIQRSSNAKVWTTLEKMAASGESTETRNYLFQDKNPLSGLNYYRLKMIDLDWSYAFSPIRKVIMEKVNLVFVYPNPASDRLYFTSSDLSDIQSASIVNGLGQKVFQTNKVAKEGIAIHNLKTGLYTVQVKKQDGTTQFQKVIVLR